ncbi:ABC transporter permease subunit [Paracoccus kondratievae]|uniref:ABC transporter permease n=1 Tax=Paracoccus kondratievae TaxID=135740 RepID=A0AAD3RUB1_9RHOB|nr:MULTISPECIES: ABC transporter permease [Paracoccus]QFQ88525.1 ABC transporter permease subunit [Paracoccus kondratievae]GLK64725.1 ABC transporter permease [Paracoccus kondratievae]SMG47790.1 peptide/nickel transport system permease protein [Paracoccus sp. J56]
MLYYLLRRLLMAVPVMFLIALIVFLLLRLTPGDPAQAIAGDQASPEQIAAIRDSLGLDAPLTTQFTTWIGNMLHGDFGNSLISQRPVLEMIGQRIGPTLALATVAMILTVIISLPLGVAAARRHGGLVDRLVMSLSVLGFSVPIFVIGYVLIGIFAVHLKWFPVQGYKPLSDGIWPFLHRIFLPGLALSSIYIALVSRMTRAAMLEVLREDYIRTARAKGLSERVVLFRHALRNAAIPILTVVGTGFAMMISGVVVTETVFNVPGLGRLVVDAVLARDYPLIQAIILLTAGTYVVINLLIDVSYALTDPRIRYQ